MVNHQRCRVNKLFLGNVTESSEAIEKEVPGLASVAKELTETLKRARLFLEKLFDLCSKMAINIDLTSEEQGEISLKVALVADPDLMIQYARIVQLVFQLNYYAKSYEKVLEAQNEIPDVYYKETKIIYENIEKYRKMIEKEYVTQV